MNRKPGWETELSDYIASVRNKDFEYGTFDCCILISDAVVAMTGEDPMAEFRGKYDSLKTSIKALREIGQGDLESTLDAKFEEIPISHARKGDIAFTEGCAGVVMGQHAWFTAEGPLERIPRAFWDKAWRVGNG